MAYIINDAKQVKETKNDFLTLNYGSASLKGYMYADKVCIDPLGSRCAKDFQFLALA